MSAPAVRRSPFRRIEMFALTARPSAQGTRALTLPVIAFAVTTALALVVAGGVRMFATDPRGGDMTPFYVVLSVIALGLLFVPAATLGAGAARLSARRRDERLAVLRLVGATTADVTVLTVAEAALTALAGAVAGIVLYVALLPLVGLLSFFGAPVGASALWAGGGVIATVVVAMVVLAAVSAALGLRRVSVTPLGVMTRAEQPRRGWWRVLAGVAAVAITYAALGAIEGVTGAFGLLALAMLLMSAFGVGLLALNLIGPPIIAARGRAMAKRSRTAVHLIAGRTLAEHAGPTWRRVSALAMVSFTAVVGGAGMSLATLAGSGEDPEAGVLFADMRTGILVTLGLAFAMVACSVGVTQAAAVLDDARMIVGLDRMGFPHDMLERSRRMTVLVPLRWAAIGGAAVGAVLTFPLVGAALLLAPMSLLVVALTFVLGFGLVFGAVWATRPLVRAVLARPARPL